ncbi:MAG: hypothetical protein ABI947_25735 [Chloroflexota bacterium]
MRRILVLTATMVTILTLIILTFYLIVMVSAGPLAGSTVLESSTCQLPCWHGLYPGKTTLHEAEVKMRADTTLADNVMLLNTFNDTPNSFFQLCWNLKVSPRWQGCAERDRDPNGPINRISMVPDPATNYTLGEALVLFGKPLAVNLCSRLGFLSARMFFANEVEIMLWQQQPVQRLDPTMRLYLVRYHYPSDEPPFQFDSPVWQGFRLLGDLPIC